MKTLRQVRNDVEKRALNLGVSEKEARALGAAHGTRVAKARLAFRKALEAGASKAVAAEAANDTLAEENDAAWLAALATARKERAAGAYELLAC